MPAREVDGYLTDINYTSPVIDDHDFRLTNDELDVFRRCAEIASTTRSITNESILEATRDAGFMSTVPTTASSSETHNQRGSVVPHEGVDVLAH